MIATYQQLHQQESQVVAIVTESGLGKTPLCQEFVNWVMAVVPSVNILTGKAFEMGIWLNHPRAIHWMLANTALQTYALSDALKHFTQAHALSRQTDVDPNSLLTFYHNRGRALELAHRFDDALTNYEELDAIAQQLDTPSHIWRCGIRR